MQQYMAAVGSRCKLYVSQTAEGFGLKEEVGGGGTEMVVPVEKDFICNLKRARRFLMRLLRRLFLYVSMGIVEHARTHRHFKLNS